MRRLTALVIFSVSVLALAACGGDDGGSSPLGGDADVPDVPEDIQDEIDEQLENFEDLPEDVTGDGEACSLLTVSEIEAEVGNSVDEGVATVSSICTWGSGAEETNVSLTVVDLPGTSACEDAWSADPAYDELDGFDGPAFTSSNTLGSIPQADVIVCSDPAQLSVTVTGGFGDPESDVDALSDQAESLAHTAVDRL